MISWIFFAVVGHMLNAIAFIIDKMLLGTAFKRSATYASMIGLLSAVTLVASPWVTAWPSGRAFVHAVLFGALFVFALWFFFEALRQSEATRVVPVVGSLIPVFTLFGSLVFLPETLSWVSLLAFIILLVATFILSGSGTADRRLTTHAILSACVSAILFAGASLMGKSAFLHASFLGVFLVSRASAAIVGLLLVCAPGVLRELRTLTHPHANKGSMHSIWLAIAGQVSGAIGFILVQVGLSAGSPSLVNALQAVQYAFIVLVAWIGGKTMQRVLHEQVTRKTLLTKGVAIVLTAVGLGLLSMSAL